ncbi:MAG TPA: MFS transporter [Oculatellaceae cyanobacterium]
MTYVLLLLSAFCLEVVLNLPVGSLPLALEHEGATREQIALAMGSGMFTALIVSIPIGALVDRIGRLATMRFAIGASFITMTALAFLPGPLLAAVFMALRSVSLSAFMTAEFAYGSTIVSKERAVSATATMGIIGNFCFALAPALAVYMWQHGIGRVQYLWAEILIVIGAILLTRLPEKHDMKISASSKRRIMMRSTWAPAILFATSCALQGGVNGSLAVLTFHDRGIANGATIFSASALTTVLLRYPASRFVEKFGARKMAIPTAIFQIVGCALAASAHNLLSVVIAGMCLGSAWSSIVPVSLALLFEQSSPRTRGAAMGAYNFSLGAGAACGAGVATAATVLGLGYTGAILCCAAAPVAALPLVLLSKNPKAKGQWRRSESITGTDSADNHSPLHPNGDPDTAAVMEVEIEV